MTDKIRITDRDLREFILNNIESGLIQKSTIRKYEWVIHGIDIDGNQFEIHFYYKEPSLLNLLKTWFEDILGARIKTNGDRCVFDLLQLCPKSNAALSLSDEIVNSISKTYSINFTKNRNYKYL